MRSPNTPLEAQCLVERGGGNSSGLTIMNTRTRATAASDHQPIHSRLQTARASRGRTAKRVQTLTGLAWRIQRSPSSPNSLVTEMLIADLLRAGLAPAQLGRGGGRSYRCSYRSASWRRISSAREDTPSFTNTLRRW
jgi:hypothetical protein